MKTQRLPLPNPSTLVTVFALLSTVFWLIYEYTTHSSLFLVIGVLIIHFYFKRPGPFDVFNLSFLLGLFVYPVFYVRENYGLDFSIFILLALMFLSLPGLAERTSTPINVGKHAGLLVFIFLTFCLIPVPTFLWLALYFLVCCHIANPRSSSPVLWLSLALFGLFVKGATSWDGFGRLVWVSYVFVPLIFAVRAGVLRIPILFVPVCVGLGLFSLQALRADDVSSLEALFMGSAGHHMVVTADIISRGAIYEPIDFFGQYFLMFFNWLPRSIFSWKPLGIGLSSVYDIYPTAVYFGDGYSHSVGFVGESTLFFGDFYSIGLGLYALSIYTLVGVLQRALKRVAQIVPVVVYMCTLSFLWGGGAAFGGRFWEPLAALLVCAFLLKCINGGSHV